MCTLTTSMADLVVITVIKIVVQVTVSVMLHLAIRDVLDGPDLKTFILFLVRVVEGGVHGAVVGGQGRQLEAVGGHVQHWDVGEAWTGSVEWRGEAWRRARRSFHPRWVLPWRRCAGRSSSRD